MKQASENTHYPVIIIGGGPAGALCGIRLLQLGIRCCIIDKAEFPRKKLCGGLLTPKSVRLLESLCPDIARHDYVCDQTQRVDFYLRDEKINDFESRSPFFFTHRETFDHRLIQEFRKLGGVVMENTRIRTSDIDPVKREVNCNGTRYHYRYLAGADGCNSVVGRMLNMKRQDAFCLELSVPEEHTRREFRIVFGYARYGYGWLFPKGNHGSLGIGDENSDKGVKKTAAAFFESFGYSIADATKGSFIPTGRTLKRSDRYRNIIVIGDAAGYTDPITGEGIYYALLSGKLVAEAIEKAVQQNSDDLQGVWQSHNRGIRRDLKAAMTLRSILYRPAVLKWFMHRLKKHKNFALFYLDEVMSDGTYSYRNFLYHYLLKKMKFKRQKDEANG